MNKLNDDYYWYDKATDTVIQCDKTQYRKFLNKNNGNYILYFAKKTLYNIKYNSQNNRGKDAIKYDKFNLAFNSLIHGEKEYVVSTVCLPYVCNLYDCYDRDPDKPLIFETIALENNSRIYTYLNYCINEAKSVHDDIILKIIREI